MGWLFPLVKKDITHKGYTVYGEGKRMNDGHAQIN